MPPKWIAPGFMVGDRPIVLSVCEVQMMTKKLISGATPWLRLGSPSPLTLGSVTLLLLSLGANAALAHHAMGGKMPQTWIEGFLSGLSHPMIGIDHFAFVVAVGLGAAGVAAWGWTLPLGFVLGTVGGTGLHLAEMNLPGLEPTIALSVVVFGGLLALGRRWPLAAWTGLGAIAGVFHGYAYGESIVGAEPTPLGAYLLGFALVQGVIALGVAQITQRWLLPRYPQALQAAGLILLGSGLAFLSAALLG